jgi:hypothetical protein
MSKYETSINTTDKPVPALKQNFSHVHNCCKIMTNWKEQNNLLSSCSSKMMIMTMTKYENGDDH